MFAWLQEHKLEVGGHTLITEILVLVSSDISKSYLLILSFSYVWCYSSIFCLPIYNTNTKCNQLIGSTYNTENMAVGVSSSWVNPLDTDTSHTKNTN